MPQRGSAEHAKRLVRYLYESRPSLCDVQIHCVNDVVGQDVVVLHAHRAILSAKCRYLWNLFESRLSDESASMAFPPPPPPPGAGGGEPVPLPHAHAPLYTVAIKNLDVVQGEPLPPAIFRGGERLMRLIIEFMYFGQLALLEDAPEAMPESDYELATRLLTWALEHHVTQMAEYLFEQLRRFPLPLEQAARLLELDAQLASSSGALSGSSRRGPSERDVANPMLEADAAAAAEAGVQSADAAARARVMAKLRRRSFAALENAPFHSDIFLPLTRNGLIMALQSCRFAVPEIEVVRAFEQWTLNSPWVASTYGGAGMHAEQVQALTLLVDPTCLSPEEFAEVDHLFLLDSQDLMWQRFLLDPDVLARQRIGPSAVCEDRSQLLPPVQSGPDADPYGRPQPSRDDAELRGGAGDESKSFIVNLRQAANERTRPLSGRDDSGGAVENGESECDHEAGAARGGGGAAGTGATGSHDASGPGDGLDITQRLMQPQSMHERAAAVERDTGVVVPEPRLTPALDPPQVLAEVHNTAHADRNKPSSVFVKGHHFYATPCTDVNGRRAPAVNPEYAYVLSVDSVSYQGVIYRGSVMRGTMRWRYNIVRNCEMFWFGVTANVLRDPSSFIAIDSNTWMVSDEGFCLEHCRPYAENPGPPLTRRIVVLEQEYFCMKDLPIKTPWETVVMDVNTATGELFCEVNGGERRRIFQKLPTQQRLYPCLMALNKGQLVFELLEAAMM